MFRKLICSVNKRKAIQLLGEMNQEFSKTNFPLQNSSLNTVNSLMKVIKGIKPADKGTVINAVLLDDPKRGNPLLNTLKDMKVHFTDEDLKFIKTLEVGRKIREESIRADTARFHPKLK